VGIEEFLALQGLYRDMDTAVEKNDPFAKEGKPGSKKPTKKGKTKSKRKARTTNHKK
jgi:hypothetical protein